MKMNSLISEIDLDEGGTIIILNHSAAAKIQMEAAGAGSGVDGWDTWSSSEVVEMFYQMCFLVIGAPINVLALRNFSKRVLKNHSNELRLVRLSSQLLVAHLLVLCIYCLWRTFWMWNIVWTLGNATCKMYSFMSALPFHLWSNVVAAIAIDTLYSVSHPLSSVQNGNKRVTWLIGLAWLFAILFASPMIFFRGVVQIPDTNLYQCYHLSNQFGESQLMAFQLFHIITTFYLPLAVILVCYIFIGISLHNQARLRKDMAKCNVPESMRGTTKRFLKATVAIVCTFVLTWLPYQVMALLRVVCEEGSHCEKTASNFNWLQSILLASTCLNPFLYRFGIFRSSTNALTRRAFLYVNGYGVEQTSQKPSNASVLTTPGKTAFGAIFWWSFHAPNGHNRMINAKRTISNAADGCHQLLPANVQRHRERVATTSLIGGKTSTATKYSGSSIRHPLENQITMSSSPSNDRGNV